MYASCGAADSAKDRYTQKSFFFFFFWCSAGGSPSNQPPDNPTCLITIGAQLLPDIALSVSDTLTPALDQFLTAVSIIQWQKCCTNCFCFVLIWPFLINPSNRLSSQRQKKKKSTTQVKTTIKEDKFAQSRLVLADRGAGGQAGTTVYGLCVPDDQLLPLPTPLNHRESLFIGEL